MLAGKIIGATHDVGNRVTTPDWHAKRSIYPEDVMATIYSLMGIDWAKKIVETRSRRPFLLYCEPIASGRDGI